MNLERCVFYMCNYKNQIEIQNTGFPNITFVFIIARVMFRVGTLSPLFALMTA